MYVNFDTELLQLVKETRALMLLGDIDVPPMARAIMLQEQKLKSFSRELTYLVREYERIVGVAETNHGSGTTTNSSSGPLRGKIINLTRGLLHPLIEEVDAVFRPGETTLT